MFNFKIKCLILKFYKWFLTVMAAHREMWSLFENVICNFFHYTFCSNNIDLVVGIFSRQAMFAQEIL